MVFESDRDKADTSCAKHAVSFSEATTVFGAPLELVISDPNHSIDEERVLSLGQSGS